MITKLQNLIKAPKKVIGIFYRIYNYILFSLSFYTQVPLSKPTNISLTVSSVCNLRCKQCDIWKNKNNTKLTYAEIKTLILQLKKWLGDYTLVLGGGEPFLNPDTVKIIEFASKNSILTSTNTNGTLINETKAEEIVKSGLSFINFSIDFPEGKSHDENRGVKGTFEKAVKGIELLQKNKIKLKLDHPLIFVNSIIMGKNIGKLHDLISFGRKIGLDGMSFQPLMSKWSFGGKKYDSNWYKNNDLWPKNIEEVEKGINNVTSLKKIYPDFFLQNSLSDLQQYKKYFKEPNSYSKHSPPCAVGIKNFVIDSLGDVRLCQVFPPIGNIRSKLTPQEIWYGVRAKSQRNTIKKCKKSCRMLLCNRKRGISDFLPIVRKYFKVLS